MRKLIIVAIFSVVLCLTNGVSAKEGGVSEVPPPEPPQPNNSSTAAPTTEPTTTTTSTTTTPSTTTKVTTTTAEPAPKTTTAAPNTTTSTTVAPTTTKPTPQPKPEVQTWVVNHPGTNYTCIVMKMALEIQVPYQKTDNKSGNATVVVPKTAEATGSCVPNATEQNLTLTWGPSPNSDSITFTFEKNDTIKKFVLHSVVATIFPYADQFPNASNTNPIVANHSKDEFLTPVAMSYRCKQEEDFMLSVPGVNDTGKFIVKNLQIQAFRNETSKDFDSAKDCESGETPGIVPIAVGCSLAALIIIVLIAYLVGRRRSQARGYLSM